MAVLLLADVIDGQLATDQVAKTLTAVKSLGPVTVLVAGMGGQYAYPKLQVSGGARYADLPMKNRYSHVCDALQYMVLGGGEGRMLIQRSGPARAANVARAGMVQRPAASWRGRGWQGLRR